MISAQTLRICRVENWRPLFCIMLKLARRDVVPELQRVRDGLDRLETLANAADRHVAVAEDAAKNGLIHVHALDLVKIHFEGPTLDEAFLVHNRQGGKVGLSGPATEPGLEGP